MGRPEIWDHLERQVRRMVESFPGVAGVCVQHLDREEGFAINGDLIFPTASTIKIPILTQLLLCRERGEIDLAEPVKIAPEMHVPGSGVLAYLDGEIALTRLNVAILMIIASDNTATNLCIDWAGMEATNALLRDLGLEHTTLRRKMLDQAAIARNEENTSTPAELVRMLALLYQGKPTPSVAEGCLSILKKEKEGSLFNRAIPATTPLANKPGGMERVRCDAGIVYLERRPYAMAVMTKFALCEPPDQERFVIDAARTIHQTMATLDSTSDYGQGIPPPNRAGTGNQDRR